MKTSHWHERIRGMQGLRDQLPLGGVQGGQRDPPDALGADHPRHVQQPPLKERKKEYARGHGLRKPAGLGGPLRGPCPACYQQPPLPRLPCALPIHQPDKRTLVRGMKLNQSFAIKQCINHQSSPSFVMQVQRDCPLHPRCVGVLLPEAGRVHPRQGQGPEPGPPQGGGSRSCVLPRAVRAEPGMRHRPGHGPPQGAGRLKGRQQARALGCLLRACPPLDPACLSCIGRLQACHPRGLLTLAGTAPVFPTTQAGPFANLFTSINLGAATRPFTSGGRSDGRINGVRACCHRRCRCVCVCCFPPPPPPPRPTPLRPPLPASTRRRRRGETFWNVRAGDPNKSVKLPKW